MNRIHITFKLSRLLRHSLSFAFEIWMSWNETETETGRQRQRPGDGSKGTSLAEVPRFWNASKDGVMIVKLWFLLIYKSSVTG